MYIANFYRPEMPGVHHRSELQKIFPKCGIDTMSSGAQYALSSTVTDISKVNWAVPGATFTNQRRNGKA